MATLRELLEFLWKRGKYALIPIVLALAGLGLLLLYAETAAVAPLIYTLF